MKHSYQDSRHLDDLEGYEPPVDRELLKKYVEGRLARKDWLEVFIIVEECNSWYKVYRELLVLRKQGCKDVTPQS